MDQNGIRLSKRMAELGLCSRSQADGYIERGLVRVDGVVVTTLGSRVRPEQTVELDRVEAAVHEAPVTLLVHRPAGFDGDAARLIRADTRHPANIAGIAFLPRHTRHLTAFGATEARHQGLVLLTQDRHLAEELTSREQEWLIDVDSAPAREALDALATDGHTLKLARQSDRQLRAVLHGEAAAILDGLVAALGIQPLRLRCQRIGRVALGELAPGQWRYRRPNERF